MCYYITLAPPLTATQNGGAVNEMLVFAPDVFEQCVTFPVIDDNIALEETESFVWTLELQGNPGGVSIGENPSTDIMVIDDDVLTITLRPGDIIPENVGVVEACIEFSGPFAREFIVNRNSQLAPNSSLPDGAAIGILSSLACL